MQINLPIQNAARQCFNKGMPGTGALILLAFAALVVVSLLISLELTRLGLLVRATIPDRPRRRMFIASVSFAITFIGVRVLVSLVLHNVGPFSWVLVGGRHIHHLVWGILILLLVGYGWLMDLGRNHTPMSIFFSRLMSVSYGAGAALTLDEFALWLNLDPDAYWSRAGRLNIDAIILFGSLLAMGAWGAPFFRGLHRLWDDRSLVGKGIRRSISYPVRLARLLRPRRARRLPTRTLP